MAKIKQPRTRARNPGNSGRGVGNPSHPGTGRFGNPPGDQPGYIQKPRQRLRHPQPRERRRPG
ncbi:MAG: hypothetical protein ACRED7_01185 [Stellaceae bacterium]